VLTAAVFACLTLSAAPLEGSGARVEESRVLPERATPTIVDVTGPVRVEVRDRDGAPDVRVIAEQELQALVRVTVDGDTLRIVTKAQPSSSEGIIVIVSMPSPLMLRVTGPVQLSAPLAGAASIDASGASRVVATGRPLSLRIKARGATAINTQAVSTGDVTVDVGGAVELDLGTSHSLSVTGTGVGKVRYRGNPKVITNVSSSVKVSRVRS
jgi:hypothetical protein